VVQTVLVDVPPVVVVLTVRVMVEVVVVVAVSVEVFVSVTHVVVVVVVVTVEVVVRGFCATAIDINPAVNNAANKSATTKLRSLNTPRPPTPKPPPQRDCKSLPTDQHIQPPPRA
jgi:hypothetical protein